MSQSLASIALHIIFSTQARLPFLKPEYRPSLFSYLAGIAKGESSYVYEIGGIEDHVHILCSLPRTISPAKLVELIKKSSSKWLKTQSHDLIPFAWQSGYGAFSVSASQIDCVREYIRNQESHHRQGTFQNELMTLLHASNISYDERYLWD